MLVAAYVVRFLPQALAGARSALGRVDPKLEDAARGLGRGPLATLRSVTLPLVAPGLLAGATLVFLSTMKELPATLLLRPIGFDTLATEVWTATGVSAYSEAAPPALALMLVSAPIVYGLTVRGGAGLEGRRSPLRAWPTSRCARTCRRSERRRDQPGERGPAIEQDPRPVVVARNLQLAAADHRHEPGTDVRIELRARAELDLGQRLAQRAHLAVRGRAGGAVEGVGGAEDAALERVASPASLSG